MARPPGNSRVHRAIGIFLICLGISPYGYAEYRLRSHDLTPLTTAVVLTSGEFQSPDFRTNLDARYLIGLTLDQPKGNDFQRTQCAMGINLSHDACARDPQTLQFDWELVSKNGNVTLRGTYEPLSVNGTDLDFAFFQGKRGATQKIVLEVHQDAGELKAGHPKLVVEAGPENSEAIAELQNIFLLWAIVVVPIGILFLRRALRRRPKSSQG
jgi:hypothetical protein